MLLDTGFGTPNKETKEVSLTIFDRTIYDLPYDLNVLEKLLRFFQLAYEEGDTLIIDAKDGSIIMSASKNAFSIMKGRTSYVATVANQEVYLKILSRLIDSLETTFYSWFGPSDSKENNALRNLINEYRYYVTQLISYVE